MPLSMHECMPVTSTPVNCRLLMIRGVGEHLPAAILKRW